MQILHTESSMGLGGQEYRVLWEAEGMKKRGHGVVIAVPQGSQLSVLAQQRGLPVKTVASGTGGWPALLFSYVRMIAQYHIDVIHTHGSRDSWIASVAGRFSKKRPLIFRTRHKSTPVSPTWRHRILYRTLPHGVITTGEAVRQALITQNKVDPSRVMSIPTGVDLARFQPAPPDTSLRRRLGISPQGPLIGAVAFLRPEKGMVLLIEAVRLLRKAFPALECLIIGDGGEKLRLASRIRERGMGHCVHMVGFRDDIPELLTLMDVMVIPSLEEGIPQSLTQALAMARPVVASAVGGIPEVVQDGVTGLLVPPRNPDLLAGKIAFLLNNPSVGTRMGRAGRQVIQDRYSIDHMLNQTENLYRRWWPTPS